MFGIGFWELSIVLAMGGVLVAIVLAVVKASLNKPSNFDFDRIARLEEENFRLRRLLAQHGIPFDGDVPPKR